MNKPIQYPLLCAFPETIISNGFDARIEVNARVLAVEDEPGSWWIYGVNPGAIAETGSSLHSAVRAFRERLQHVLEDYATEWSDFESFKRHVEEFFNTCDSETENEWLAAREAVRAGRVDLPDMRRVTEESPQRINIRLIERRPAAVTGDSAPPAIAA